MKTSVSFSAALFLLSMSFSSCAQDMDQFERVILVKNGYTLKYKHIVAAVYIASEEMGAELADPQINAIQQAMMNAFDRDPEGTVRDLENAWNSIIAGNTEKAKTRQNQPFKNTSSTLQQQWEQFLMGKAMVRSVSTSEGSDGLYIANKTIEQYRLFPDGTFFAALGSQSAGSGIELNGIDDAMQGYWNVQAINEYQAMLTLTVNGQPMQMPLMISGNQLYLAGNVVSVVPFQ